ncbi:hypothetical protein C8R44DRAFT_783468 [Mycena epipterygia]|nr:hypothetical protein C8R44DRAFT_783468 [Mycena epipterygia]
MSHSKKPEQPNSDSYQPRTSAHIEFEFHWKSFRVNPVNVNSDFPFRLDLVGDRHPVRFLEFRALCDPPFDLGNPGDIWLNISPTSYALFALNANREWVKWPGATLDRAHMIPHPYLPLYALWCTIKQASWYHREKLGGDWVDEKLTARRELGGYQCAANMLDASVGVRLILLREEMEEKKCTGEPTEKAASPSASTLSMLNSVLGELATTSAIPETKDTFIATLSKGIDFLLDERRTLSRALSAAEARAEIAEKKLAALSESSTQQPNNQCPHIHDTERLRQYPPNTHYRDRCFAAPILQAPSSPTVYTPAPWSPTFLSEVTLANAPVSRYTDHETPARSPPPAKRRKTHSVSPPKYLDSPPSTPPSSSSPTLYSPFHPAQATLLESPTAALSSATITSKHLDVMYRTAEDGRSKHCRICLALVTYNHRDESALVLHVEGLHPDECAVLGRASDELLEAARRQLDETDRERA